MNILFISMGYDLHYSTMTTRKPLWIPVLCQQSTDFLHLLFTVFKLMTPPFFRSAILPFTWPHPVIHTQATNPITNPLMRFKLSIVSGAPD